MTRCFLLLFLVLWSVRAQAFDQPTFTIQGEQFVLRQQNDYSLGNVSERLSFDELAAALKEDRFHSQESFRLEYGRYFYFAYLLDNQNQATTRVFLKLPGKLPESQVFTYEAGGFQTWTRYPGDFEAFYKDIPPGKTIVVGYRLASGNLRGRAVDVTLYDFQSFVLKVASFQKAYAWMQGATLMLVFYNLCMLLMIRKSYFFYYSLYSLSALSSVGFFLGDVAFDVPKLTFVSLVAEVSLLLFCERSLSLTHYHPRYAKFQKPVLALLLVNAGIAFISKELMAMMLGSGIVLGYCIVASFLRWRSGFAPARMFLVGWALFFFGMLISFLNIVVVGNPYLSWALMYGFALEIGCFSLAISQKARLSEQKHLQATEHAFFQLQKVFYPHQIQQMKAGSELETTMPTGEGFACVLAFDIISSTQIPSDRVKTFLEDALKSCLGLVGQGYDATKLISRAYRIKEMGDGFLCSIGFPFASPEGERIADASVQLAYDIVRVFESVVQKHLGSTKVFCSIGLAYDRLEGYFPTVGTVEYDVYGRAVVLATRYEGLRKLLFPDGVKGHVITLQEQVYQQLSAERQQDFITLDLAARRLSVRDDAQAATLAYRVIS